MFRNEKGFSIVEILAVVLIISLIGAISWLLYDRQLKPTNDSATTGSSQQLTEQNALEKETADWYLYEPAQKEYRLKVADGWVLRKKEGTDTSLYSTASLALTEGTKGQVAPYDPSSSAYEFDCGLYIDWQTYNDKAIYDINTQYDTEKPVAFTTFSGISVHKTSTLHSGGGYIPVGSKLYSYFLARDFKTLRVGYSACPNSEDYHEIVEKVVRTIAIN